MSFTNEIWLAIRNDKADGQGGGTPSDPYAVNTPSSFAAIMGDLAKVPEDCIVRLGPGVFRTRGGGGNGVTSVPAGSLWIPHSGQKLVGSGMFSTTLQFDWDIVPTGVPGPRHFMLKSDVYLNSYELSDLTLDCNLQNTPFGKDPVITAAPITATLVKDSPDVTATGAFFTVDMIGKIAYFSSNVPPSLVFSGKILSISNGGLTATFDRIPEFTFPETSRSGVSFWVFYPRFSVTAVSLIGDNIRVRRVRCINFGTRTPLYFDGQSEKSGQIKSAEGFPLRIEGRTRGIPGGDTPAFNSWLEDRIVEQPYPFSAREVTFVAGGGIASEVAPPEKLHLEPFAVGIRNCYMNFDFVNPDPGNPVPIAGITFSGAAPNVDATVTTRFPLFVKVDDYVEMSGNDVAALNGRFKVAAIGSPECVKGSRTRAKRRSLREKRRTRCQLREAREERSRKNRMSLHWFRFLLFLIIAISSTSHSSRAQTNTLIVPPGMETAFGQRQIRPFPVGYPSFEQIYASNLFLRLPTDTIVITEMAFRLNESGTPDLDIFFRGLFVALNTNRGSLEEILSRGFGYEFPRTTVYHDDLRMQGRVGITNAFDIRIPFLKPFAYDRRKGHLVVAFGRSTSDERVLFDAHGRDYDFGFAIFSGGGMNAIAQSGIPVTRFSYYVPPRITNVSVVDGNIEIHFDFSGSFEHLVSEFSGNVAGPYVAIQDSAPVLIDTGKAIIRVPLKADTMFFRLQYPL